MSNNDDLSLLSIRLKGVFDMIPEDAVRSRFIDVGSDHGHLTCYALNIGGFESSISTDIHKEPANKTRMFLEEMCPDKNFEVYCTDGLDGISLKSNDIVVMAGLGGNNIIDILKRAKNNTDEEILKSVTFILQPQKSIEVLREYAYNNGFNIENESALLDRDIYYAVLVIKYDSVIRTLDSISKFYGPILVKKYNESNEDVVLNGYFDLLDKRYELRSRGDEEVKLMLDLKRGN